MAIAAALATFAGVAASQQAARSSAGSSSEAPLPVNPPGYVVAFDGRPVLSGFGSCVRSSQWVLANSVDPCDQIARVSVPVPVVTYEQAAPPPPPPPVVVAPPEPPRPVIEKLTLSTDGLFDFDKAELKDVGKQKLDELASQIKGAKVDEIVVVGHADRIGPENYNEKLSEARAQSVKDYLAERGAQTNVISAQGKGESAPVTGDQCKKMAGKKLLECLQPDRRVEIEVLGSREVAGTGAPAAGGTR
ncbi:MAG TPA: OmpA family protein [Burkholderiales bacterium]|nr:OmpA family protein [Burkholderiales bacterium]